MCLVAHLGTMPVGPVDPLLREVLEQQVRERFAIVAKHLITVIHHT